MTMNWHNVTDWLLTHRRKIQITIGILCMFLACFKAWDEQYTARLAAEDALAASFGCKREESVCWDRFLEAIKSNLRECKKQTECWDKVLGL